ncbi:hypothetical protein BDY19DRAFT_997141 [Irpex rosettiformis]|uniref:Uncharacterized protein n=1 Tax=Irpex rosettiformis TaxID=378272 RepID=A0ACB8TSV5_9APHY|nr:hypothetical protein BDY19DRAFT_997141 [Irpex rosettiformis]
MLLFLIMTIGFGAAFFQLYESGWPGPEKTKRFRKWGIGAPDRRALHQREEETSWKMPHPSTTTAIPSVNPSWQCEIYNWEAYTQVTAPERVPPKLPPLDEPSDPHTHIISFTSIFILAAIVWLIPRSWSPLPRILHALRFIVPPVPVARPVLPVDISQPQINGIPPMLTPHLALGQGLFNAAGGDVMELTEVAEEIVWAQPQTEPELELDWGEHWAGDRTEDRAEDWTEG